MNKHAICRSSTVLTIHLPGSLSLGGPGVGDGSDGEGGDGGDDGDGGGGAQHRWAGHL